MEFFRFYNSLLNVWTYNFLANLCAAFQQIWDQHQVLCSWNSYLFLFKTFLWLYAPCWKLQPKWAQFGSKRTNPFFINLASISVFAFFIFFFFK
jgi:hypothetical protein